MANDFALPSRRSIRLRNYDYRAAGAYFVTICTQDRRCLFGEVLDGRLRHSPIGEQIRECWLQVPAHFPSMELDEWQVMPNHFHGILVITSGPAPEVSLRPRANDIVPLRKSPRAGSLAAILGNFKAAVTRAVRTRIGGAPVTVWQRSYYEHVVRSEEELNRIREYVAMNLLRWELDRENPQRVGEDEFDTWLDSLGDGKDKNGRE